MKTEIRKTGLQVLKTLELNKEKKQAWETMITADLFNDELFLNAKTIGVVLSSSFEFNTQPILEQAWQANKKIVTPRCFKGHQMDFFVTTNQTPLVKTKFGVLEPQTEERVMPEEIDLLIVPGVVFRKDGYRVGFGGGFYDRYLKRFSGETVSLVFPEQFNENFEPDQYDRAVARIFTANGVYA